MKYRRFGRTGIQMPVISCGGMRYQHSWDDVDPQQIPTANQANLEACVQRALDLGVNHLETARGYGTSEIQMGRLLPSLKRDQIILQTKVSPKSTAAEFLRTFEQSMANLRVDRVDLLSIHGINNRQLLDWTLQRNGCLAVARNLQRQGRVGFIGFSTHAPTQIIVDAIQTGEFDYVNLHWYFVNHLNWPAVKAAHARDMGVFIISPNDKGGKLYTPPPKLARLCEPLTPMQFNDLYCLARPQVHTLSCGVAKPEDFDEHVAALEHYDSLGETIAPIEKRLRDEMKWVLGADWCARWFEGLPEYEQVPGNINILEILRLWTYANSLDLVDWGKMRYNLLGQADHWFPGANAGSLKDGELAGCLRESPFRDRIPDILRQAHDLFFERPMHRLGKS